jgi:peptidoglycan/xylan/chitin deacetylase (PgdA/CDA1 family)
MSMLAGISARSVTAQDDKKEIMLSFDDGPIPGATEYILDQLDLIEALPGVEGARAGFFMIGIDKSLSENDFWQPDQDEYWGVQQNPTLVQEVANRGHFVFSHTLHHPSLRDMQDDPAMVDEEVIGAYDLIVATGVSTQRIFRAPRGQYPEIIAPDSRLATEGWKKTGHGVTTGDPHVSDESAVIAIAKLGLEKVTEWPVALGFHDMRGRNSTWQGIYMPQLNYVNIITELVASGYTLVDFDPARIQEDLIEPGEEGGCFIATAAYGSYLDSHVETLRNFRDSYMVTNPVGSALVSTYYKLSPPVAEFIDDNPTLKPIVRVGLLPAVAMSTVAVNTTLAEKVAIVGALALVSVALAVWLSRRRGKGVIS